MNESTVLHELNNIQSLNLKRIVKYKKKRRLHDTKRDVIVSSAFVVSTAEGFDNPPIALKEIR